MRAFQGTKMRVSRGIGVDKNAPSVLKIDEIGLNLFRMSCFTCLKWKQQHQKFVYMKLMIKEDLPHRMSRKILRRENFWQIYPKEYSVLQMQLLPDFQDRNKSPNPFVYEDLRLKISYTKSWRILESWRILKNASNLWIHSNP